MGRQQQQQTGYSGFSGGITGVGGQLQQQQQGLQQQASGHAQGGTLGGEPMAWRQFDTSLSGGGVGGDGVGSVGSNAGAGARAAVMEGTGAAGASWGTHPQELGAMQAQATQAMHGSIPQPLHVPGHGWGMQAGAPEQRLAAGSAGGAVHGGVFHGPAATGLSHPGGFSSGGGGSGGGGYQSHAAGLLQPEGSGGIYTAGGATSTGGTAAVSGLGGLGPAAAASAAAPVQQAAASAHAPGPAPPVADTRADRCMACQLRPQALALAPCCHVMLCYECWPAVRPTLHQVSGAVGLINPGGQSKGLLWWWLQHRWRWRRWRRFIEPCGRSAAARGQYTAAAQCPANGTQSLTLGVASCSVV